MQKRPKKPNKSFVSVNLIELNSVLNQKRAQLLFSSVQSREDLVWVTSDMESKGFSLDDYDCIGFDLDCTIVEYNVKELVKLVYDLLAKYLIEKKSYENEFLLRPYEEDEYFLQKGLFMDLKKGNVLKIDENGVIFKATHGTKRLSDENIQEIYGPDRSFSAFKRFIKQPLSIMYTLDEILDEKLLRATLDCFDMSAVLIFARIIDHLDQKKKNSDLAEYCVWPDILAGLYHLYSRNHFATGESEFFSALKENPGFYLKKWTPEKLTWLKEVKSKKFVFLLTGSFIDFASFTASYCIGENWKDYFDIVLCGAKKPFFFFLDRPFLYVVNDQETEAVREESLEINTVYSQGNWQKLKALIAKQTNVTEPKCLYIGDNLIQDVYSPVHFKCCHSVAVSLELKDEFKSSQVWDSYFEASSQTTSYCNYLIRSHATVCVSGLDVFSSRPFNFRFSRLKQSETCMLDKSNGYYSD